MSSSCARARAYLRFLRKLSDDGDAGPESPAAHTGRIG
jgi:hypothetical protein